MNPLWKSAAVALVIIGIAVPLSFFPAASAHQMSRFNSYDELINFIQSKPSACPGTSITPLVRNPGTNPSTLVEGQKSALTVDHSSTNVQVQGVDELDTVKSDGQYIYTITNNTLVIVKAYPVSEAAVVSRITPNETLTGVFVVGDKLVLIGGEAGYAPFLSGKPILGMASGMRVSYFNPITRLWVYDISSRSKPLLTLTLKQTGSYEGSRLISNSVYLITTENLFVQNNRVNLPSIALNGQNSTVPPTEIYHSDIPDYYYSLTSVDRLDLNGPPKLTSETFLIGTSSTIYSSTGNIYLTSVTWACNQETVIHRVSISDGNVNYEATGTVPGHILNQFSMDETNGYFRVATSNYGSTPVRAMPPTTIAQPVQPTPVSQLVQQTNLYVLDSSLHIAGRLEGLSPGEAFYAARFMGDRAYLVTFQRMDPLFVIGLQDPYHPKVLGQLNITGVSDYLQPYDETHLIGFGKSSTNVTWENAALFQGLKLSLFDVTDPSHPIDTSNYLVGDRGSDSPALTDHKSVLFDHSLNLLVIPLEIARTVQNSTYSWGYNPMVWQGAYVFSVTLGNGVVFRGGITHLSSGETPSWNNTNRFITRSLYIGSVLYTISPAMLKMNSLADLSELGTVTL
jgi:inhibitor of cysteine peptidase